MKKLKSYNCAVLPGKRLLFSVSQHPAAVSAVDFLLRLMTSQLGKFSRPLAAVRAVFFSWLKSYNCAVLPWKSILCSANFHDTQLLWVPWIFLSKIIDKSVGPILTAPCCRKCGGFLCWHKFYNCAVLPLKCLLFSAYIHGTQLPWVQWIFCVKFLTSRLG